MNPSMQEPPLYKYRSFWGVVGIFILVGSVALSYLLPNIFFGVTTASGAVDGGAIADLEKQYIPTVATRYEMSQRAHQQPEVKIVFADSLVQADFEKISSQYSECLANADCAIKGNLWDLYTALQGKTNELGAETVQYYIINLLNHMMRKLEGTKSYRDAYRGSARKIIEDINKEHYALSTDWIILADITYQAGDLTEAKNLYNQTLEMARQSSTENEDQIDVDTLSRVKNRCLELGCEVSASLDPGSAPL